MMDFDGLSGLCHNIYTVSFKFKRIIFSNVPEVHLSLAHVAGAPLRTDRSTLLIKTDTVSCLCQSFHN